MSEEGFEPLGLVSQRDFLHRLGLREFSARLREESRSQREVDANRMAMLELARADGLGAFKVAIHGRGVPGSRLTGIDPAADGAEAACLPLPTLRKDEAGRVPLLEGKYPEGLGFEAPWAPPVADAEDGVVPDRQE